MGNANSMFPIQPLEPPWDRRGLELLMQGMPPASRDRQIDRIEAVGGAAGIAGLLGVIGDGEIIGVVWAQMLPGGTATIWPPRAFANEEDLGPRLAIAAIEFAGSSGARIALAMVGADDADLAEWLEAAGMQPAAEVLSLVWLAPPTMTFELLKTSAGLSYGIEPYQPVNDRARLEQVLAETFVGSADCPALDGVRAVHDVLRGYQAAGVSQSRHWYFLRHEQHDAGCLLLAEHVAPEDMELVYMGLTPAFRGRGLGNVLARYAQELTCRAGRQCLLTTVDANNAPACQAYDNAGFFRWDRRQVLLRVFGK